MMPKLSSRPLAMAGKVDGLGPGHRSPRTEMISVLVDPAEPSNEPPMRIT